MAYPNRQGPSFCTACGQPFQAGTSFCRKCGSRLPVMNDATPVSQQSNPPASQQNYVPASQQNYIPPSQRTYPLPDQSGFTGGYLTPEREAQEESPLRKKQSENTLIKLVLILLLIRTILLVICNVISHETFWLCVEHLFAPIPLEYESLMLIVLIGVLRGKSTKKLFCCLLAMLALFNLNLYHDGYLHWISTIKDASGFENRMYALVFRLDDIVSSIGYPLTLAFVTLLCAGDGFAAKTRKGIAKAMLLVQLIVFAVEVLYSTHLLIWGPHYQKWTDYVTLMMTLLEIVVCIGWLCSGDSSKKAWTSLTISSFAVIALMYFISQWDFMVSLMERSSVRTGAERFEQYSFIIRTILIRGVYCVGTILAGTILCRSKSGEETEE